MEGLMLAGGLAALCRATVHRRGWCVLYLRLIMLVSMTTADPPAEDWSLLASNMLQQPLGEVPHYTDSPSALQTSSPKLVGQSSEVGNMFSARPIIDPPKASENYYSHSALGLAGHDPEPLSVPGLISSEWGEEKRIGFEVSSRLKRNVKAHRMSSDQRTDSSGVQLSLTLPRLSVPALNISSSEFISAALDSSEESPFPLPELQTASGDQVEPSRRIRDFDYLHPSYDLNIQNDAKPDVHLLNPSHTLLGNYRVTSSSTEPTMGPLENFFLTSTMDVDYGSGDYLETVSFVGSDSLVTNLPSDMYEFEDSNSASYDTSFPTRVGMPLSTRLLSPSPISATYSTHVTTFPNPTFAVNHNATISPKVNKTGLVRQIPTSRVTTSNLSVLPRLPASIPDIRTHLPIYSTIYSDLTAIQPTAVHSLPIVPSMSASIDKSSSAKESSDTDWPDNISIEPTDVLLPDMNSLEYYTIQLSKGTVYLPEQESNHTSSKYLSLTPVNTVHIKATATDSVNLSHMLTEMYGLSQPVDNSSWIEESSTDITDFDPFNSTILDLSEGRPHLVNTTELFPVVPSETLNAPVDFYTSLWDLLSTPDWTSTESVPNSTSMPLLIPFTEQPGVTPPNDTDIFWFANSSWTESPSPTPPITSHVLTHIHSAFASPTASTSNTTFIHPMTESADQGATAEPSERPFLTVATPSTSVLHNETTVAFPSAVTVTMTKASDSTILPITVEAESVTALRTSAETTTVREYLCNITKSDSYLVRAGFSPGSTAGFAKAKVREILKAEFNRSVELQVVRAPPDFVFWAVSGRVVYTAASVMNVLLKATRSSRTILSVSHVRAGAGLEYHVHSVLQFVPSDVDVHVCTFSEHMEKGLTMAFAEVLRRSKEYSNFTVRVLNITVSPETKMQRQLSGPVDITFVVCDAHGYILGSEVSALLRQLSMVEFSYYMGYPVQQIAEPFYYPELNTTQLLRSSWVRTVLLGVGEQHVRDKIFQAKMERRLAVLLGEGLREEMGEELGRRRRLRRATRVGNNSVQIVQTTRLMGSDNPLDMIYFVEGANGERLPATTTADLLNRLDVQHAAIVLGYRIQGALAQPVEKLATSPSEMESATTWIIVGVVVPVVLVVIIIAVLYWKLCRTDKLEFQPDAVSTAQQRQKKSIPAIQRSVTPARIKKVEVIESIKEDKEEEEEERRERKKKKDSRRLQPPSVKGFDFAKLHLGQHSKDDLVVIQEPLPLPAASKEPGSGETIEASSPKSKGSSTKTSRCVQLKRGRISPSDGDSLGSDPSSERESPEENPRPIGASVESRQQRRTVANGQDGPPAVTGADEHLSSASMFEHVERVSRSADVPNKRFSSNIQLIALQPIPALAVPQTPGPDHTAQSAKINKEIQVALRQKSEIEHHRNKIRLRAKRKGHYDFPTMHDVTDGLGDPKEQDRIYQKAQMQIDKILDPHVHMPPLYTEPKKSGREKRSPRQKKKQHMNGDVPDADRDRLITTDSDGTYKKYPGVNNIAYVSDPDQGPELSSPSPSDDVFLGPVSPPPGHAPPPPPYLPPQPSIEEARQQMHSLLDDAFALVSPSAQGSNAGITLPGAGVPLPAAPSSPPSRGPPHWGPSYTPLSPFPARYAELGLSPPAVQGLLHRSRYPPGDAPGGEQLQSEVLYNSRGCYMDELPSSARPRPVGGSTGAQLHHLTQMGMSSSMGEGRSLSGLNWGPHHEEDLSKPANRDPSSRNGIREPTAPPAQLDTVALGYPSSAPPEEYSSPSHSSASLIKAIREELMRLSQKQASVTAYHS